MYDLIECLFGLIIEVCIEILECLLVVVVDLYQFELVIFNFVVNVCDVMGEGGCLEIGVWIDLVIDGVVDGFGVGCYVCLEVVDNGGGMFVEVLVCCMELFFFIKGVGKGIGFGLLMVQGLVVQFGGGLGIYLEIGKGIWVSIWLLIIVEQM